MFNRLTFFFVLCMLVLAATLPADSIRQKRDVMDSVKNAWGEVTKTISDAGDTVVHVFKPTEKSTIDKIADSVKGIGE